MNLEKDVTDILNKFFDQDHELVDFKDQRGDGKHFTLKIISDKFEGMGRLARSKMVYSLLNEFMTTGKIHALQLRLKTPNEQKN